MFSISTRFSSCEWNCETNFHRVVVFVPFGSSKLTSRFEQIVSSVIRKRKIEFQVLLNWRNFLNSCVSSFQFGTYSLGFLLCEFFEGNFLKNFCMFTFCKGFFELEKMYKWKMTNNVGTITRKEKKSVIRAVGWNNNVYRRNLKCFVWNKSCADHVRIIRCCGVVDKCLDWRWTAIQHPSNRRVLFAAALSNCLFRRTVAIIYLFPVPRQWQTLLCDSVALLSTLFSHFFHFFVAQK